jgi:cytochrome P450
MAEAAAGKTPTFPTLMERLLIPIPEKGYAVPDKQGLRDELLTVISAGDDTTGIANTVTLFNIFNNREIHDRLLAELKTVMPTPDSYVSYLRLEALPYLVRRSYLPLSEVSTSCQAQYLTLM